MTEATKNDAGKPRLELVMTPGLVEIAKAMTYGADKYGADNYLRGEGLNRRRLAGAALRHLTSWLCGEELDPESGLNHLAHAGASVLMLLTLVAAGKGADERRQPEPWSPSGCECKYCAQARCGLCGCGCDACAQARGGL